MGSRSWLGEGRVPHGGPSPVGEMRRRDRRNRVCSPRGLCGDRPRVNTGGRGGGWAGRREGARWSVVGGQQEPQDDRGPCPAPSLGFSGPPGRGGWRGRRAPPGLSALPPPRASLAGPRPAVVFSLSPVYFASSAHTAFADRRHTVGWEDFFLLCFCRKCPWLRAGYREVLGLQAPVQRAWVGRAPPPPPNTPSHRLQPGTPSAQLPGPVPLAQAGPAT